MRHLFILSAILILLSQCRLNKSTTISQMKHCPDKENIAFFGNNNSNLIFTCNKVIIYSISQQLNSSDKDNKVIPYQILDSITIVDHKLDSIQQLFSKKENFHFDNTIDGKCSFQPSICFSFNAPNKEKVNLYYAFNCNKIGFFENNRLKSVLTSIKPNLIGIAKDFFPNDSDFKKL